MEKSDYIRRFAEQCFGLVADHPTIQITEQGITGPDGFIAIAVRCDCSSEDCPGWQMHLDIRGQVWPYDPDGGYITGLGRAHLH
jgi:hypothetical protein